MNAGVNAIFLDTVNDATLNPSCDNSETGSQVSQWSCLFVIFCWLLWKERCTRIFDPESCQHEDILTRGNRLAAEYAHGFAPSTRQLSIGSVPPRSWSRPVPGDGLVKVILEWTQREWKLVVRHVSRDCNHLADRIAASGRTTSRSGMVIADSPASLAALVEEEADRVLVDSNMVAWVRDGHTACFNMVDTRVDSAFWFLFLGLFLL
ncbi:hypothetical protein V6N13_106390 [Hibiscus sabdariffa]